MSNLQSNPVRGMRDLLPQKVESRERVFEIIKRVYKSFGFTQIETPVVENISLLTSNEGGETEKQIFTILKRGLLPDDIKSAGLISQLIDSGLRFDLTIPLVRYYSNNRVNLPDPFKSLQIGNVWRAEKPQKGRYRQFIQCDADIIGEASNLAEKEIISVTTQALTKIGFSGFKVRINDRRILKGIVQGFGCKKENYGLIFIIIDKIDKIGIKGVESELIKIGIQEESVKKIITFLSKAQKVTDEDKLFNLLPKNIKQEVIDSLKDVMVIIRDISNDKFDIVFDPMLVRGMGYYTGQIFEVEDSDYPVALAGGGRYDKMVGKYLKENVPACGFSIGFERIMSLVEKRGLLPDLNKDKKVLLFDPKKVDNNTIILIANALRKEGQLICIQKKRKNTRKQLDDLARFGYCAFAIVETQIKVTEISFKKLNKL